MHPARISPKGVIAVRDPRYTDPKAPWRVVYVPAGVWDLWKHWALSDQAVAAWTPLVPQRAEGVA